MYLERAEEEDRKMAESWKADADGILIFVRFYPQILGFTYATRDRLVYSLLPSRR